MSLKNSIDTIGNRTRDLPVCSATVRPQIIILPRSNTKQINGHSNCQPCPPSTRHSKYYVRARQLWPKFSRKRNLHQQKIRRAFFPRSSIYLISYSPQTPIPPPFLHFPAGFAHSDKIFRHITAPVFSTGEFSLNNVLQFLG